MLMMDKRAEEEFEGTALIAGTMMDTRAVAE